MLRVWPILVCLFWIIPLAHAQCPGVTTQQTAFATEQLTITDIETPLTASIYKPSGITPSMAVVAVEGGGIRYQVVAATPTSAGQPVLGGSTFSICGVDSIAAFKAVRLSTDALLTIIYYKTK
jgi:hypothetical protein